MKNRIFFLLSILNLYANDGIDTGNNLRTYFSDVQNNIAAPLTSNTEFKTLNGKKNFSANLTCNDTLNSFLEITYSGFSDITLNITVDIDLNGTKDKYFSFSGISGIGTNGVVICNSNSWNNCKYFLWNLTNNNLSLQEVKLTDLSGVYCINSSCGNLATNQKTTILNTIGGTISSLYQNSNSNYLVTKTSNDGNKILFYGQNYQNCQNLKDSAPSQSQALDTTNVINTQSKNENSIYYTFNKNVQNQNQNNFNNDINETMNVRKSINVNGNKDDYTFTYSGKQKNQDGSWSLKNDNAKVNIDFLNPNIKYCEIKYLDENSIVFSDSSTHYSSVGETKTWKTKIIECLGVNYDTCPINTNKNEIIKHPCGDIDNFAEATSILNTVNEAVSDFSCSK